ncbi:MAG: Hint domain-containing protein [Polyangiaceae bacterium]
MRGRTLRGIAWCALLLCCACKEKPAPVTSPSGTSAPTGSFQPTQAPAKQTPAILAKTVQGPFNEGLALELRPTVPDVTSDDHLDFVLRIRAEKLPPKGDPAWQETLDFNEVLNSLEVTIEDPKGKKQTLHVGAVATPWVQPILSTTISLQLDKQGIRFGNALSSKWKEAPEDWLKTPGTYRVSVHADFAGKLPGATADTRNVKLSAGPLDYHVEAPSPRFRSLAELTGITTKWVQDRQGTPKVRPAGAVLEDEAKNRSFRYTLESERYDITVVEVLVDPSGKEVLYDVFSHFTCVAEGTPIATPNGDVAVERLTPGTLVSSFDVEQRTLTSARVNHVEAHNAVELVQLGQLLVTAHHPVFSDGRWVEAGRVAADSQLVGVAGQSLEVTPRAVRRAGVVYELSVSEPHTYFASGVLLHNKAVYVPIGGSQDWLGLFYRRAAKTTK